MTNIEPVAKQGVRKSTLPDEIWARVEPTFREQVGVGKAIRVKTVADSLEISSPSVSTWLNGHGRPTIPNLMGLISILKLNPFQVLPEYFPAPEPWRQVAIENGDDPEDPRVRSAYELGFEAAKSTITVVARSQLSGGYKALPSPKLLLVADSATAPEDPEE